MSARDPNAGSRRNRRMQTETECHCCRKSYRFCWKCRKCGFAICQNCMNEWVRWLSCNGITWYCPDCGETNGFGNQ